MKRLALVVALAMILATFGSGIAAADPLNSPKADIISVTCSNGQTYEVLSAGGQPGHILGSNSNIIPVAFTATVTDPETGEILFSGRRTVGQGDKQGLQDDLITCIAGPFTEVNPETGEPVTIVFLVEAFLTPRGQ